jgi:ABC-type multidrug transport system fused ATPase/permease subunit
MLAGKTTEQLDKERIDSINKSYSIPWKRLWYFSKPEKWLYIPAILGAFVKGSAFPIHSVIFSAVISWYYIKTDLMKKVSVASLEYVALGVAVFIGIVIDLWVFSIISESFTLRVRKACFKHILSQDMSFFDKSENTPARLQLALSTWTSKMNAITTNVIGVYCEVFAALVAGLIIAFLASPKLAAVLLATLPIVVGTSAIATSAMLKMKDDAKMAQQAAQVASEAVQNMKTVRALNAEAETLYLYEQLSMKRTVIEQKKAWTSGLIFGFAMGAIFLPYSLGYWYGGRLVASGELDLQNLTQALVGLLLSAMGAGQALSFMADVAVAKAAAHDVFVLLDTPTKIDPFDKSHGSNADEVFPANKTHGSIEFDSVHFAYPSRPDVPILRGLTFKVDHGQKIALVGPSGGGKSTVMALLLRFYDPTEGTIRINGNDARNLDVSALRAAMGYVGQEPVLFNTTMEENVLYGKREANKDELEEVQRIAKLDFVGDENVHWDTVLGPKGGLLSGGQKQRTAIARALIRDPRILLLDEATSALDSASEHVVQKAIDSATIGRTTFVIAHRLSTIQDADQILVIAGGRMIESGTHTGLMTMRGAYYQLYMQGQK